MFVRTATRRNKDGTAVRYLQLVHNEWDPATKSAKMRVLHNFGREDQVDKAAIERLAGSLCRLLEPGRAAALRGPGLSYRGSVAFGGPWLLDQLWARLGIGAILRAKLGGTRWDASAERVLFALVASLALDASSRLTAAHWVGRKAWIEALPATSDDACYRAMDWLHQVGDGVEQEISCQVANLLNLEVDLLFVDTTSTYFEAGEEDEAVPKDGGSNVTDDEREAAWGRPAGFRVHGKPKDHRDDLPQVMIGMAVTRDGIPLRIWCWPGNTADAVRQVKDDMRDWALSRVVWAADRGFTTAENRRHLRPGDHHYIIGEKLRSGSPEARAALSRQGRYTDVAENLKVKEVRITDDERFVICRYPGAAERDARARERMLTQLSGMIAGSGKLTKTKRAELRALISTKPGLSRYLRVTPGGLLRTDATAIKAEADLDGKYLLRTSDPDLSAGDIALGYKRLLEVERGWRDLTQVIDLRPTYHRKEERIRAHVTLCWLALLLIRIAETTAGAAWNEIADEMELLTLATFTGPAGTCRQTAELTRTQRDLLARLKFPHPRKIIEATPATVP